MKLVTKNVFFFVGTHDSVTARVYCVLGFFFWEISTAIYWMIKLLLFLLPILAALRETIKKSSHMRNEPIRIQLCTTYSLICKWHLQDNSNRSNNWNIWLMNSFTCRRRQWFNFDKWEKLKVSKIWFCIHSINKISFSTIYFHINKHNSN